MNPLKALPRSQGSEGQSSCSAVWGRFRMRTGGHEPTLAPLVHSGKVLNSCCQGVQAHRAGKEGRLGLFIVVLENRAQPSREGGKKQRQQPQKVILIATCVLFLAVSAL